MSTKKLTCLVIEDEPDTRDWIVTKLALFPEVEVVGTASEIGKAFELISIKKPDFIFLDINLIGGDGFQLINKLKSSDVPVPYIMMATAFQDFIFEAFNSHREYVLQFLMKPFVDGWYEQFRTGINAVIKNKNKSANITPSTEKPNYIFIPNRGNLIRLDFSKIAYLEAAGSGKSNVILNDRMHLVDLTLNKFMELLPDNFFRISRNNIINLNLIENINKGDRTASLSLPNGITNLGITEPNYKELLSRLPVKK